MSVASWFIVEREPRVASARPTDVAAAPVAGRVAVLLEAPRQRGLAAVLGLALVRAERADAVLILAWRSPSPGGPGAPAMPAARRMVRTLRARGLPARAAGRIVRVDLPDDEEEAATAAAHGVAAAPAAMPAVIAVGGARGAALDALLAGADVIVVPGCAEDPRGRAALEGAAHRGGRAVSWCDAPGALGRRLAGAGLPVPGRDGLPAEALR